MNRDTCEHFVPTELRCERCAEGEGMNSEWYCPQCGPIAPSDATYPGLGTYRYCRTCIDVRVQEGLPPFVTAMQEQIAALQAENTRLQKELRGAFDQQRADMQAMLALQEIINKLTAERDRAKEVTAALDSAMWETTPATLNGSEAVYGFAAWLTCRTEKNHYGATEDAAVVAELVDLFCQTNNLPLVRETWPEGLIHPPGREIEQEGV